MIETSPGAHLGHPDSSPHSAGAAQGSDEAAAKLAWIVKENGDCLWYLSQLAQDLGVDLEEVARLNLRKLAERYGLGGRKIIPMPAAAPAQASQPPVPAVFSGDLLVRCLRGCWTGEGRADEVEAMESAEVVPWGDGTKGFFVCSENSRVLVTVAEIPGAFPALPGRFPGDSRDSRGNSGDSRENSPRRVNVHNVHSPAGARARGLADDLRDLLAEREAQTGALVTVRRASEMLDVPFMAMVETAWAEGFTMAGLPDPMGLLSPYMRRGLTMGEIRAQTGVSEETIRDICKEAEWEVPP